MSWKQELLGWVIVIPAVVALGYAGDTTVPVVVVVVAAYVAGILHGDSSP